MTASGERRSLTVTLIPSSRSSSRSPTSIGRFTTRVTVASSVSSSAAAAGRSGIALGSSASITSRKAFHVVVMSAPRGGGGRPCRGQRGGHDVLVARAAAEVPGDRLADLGFARIRRLSQEARERHQKARSAEAALKPVVLAEGLLQRVEPLAVREPLHRLQL